jgi:hypothetical protein
LSLDEDETLRWLEGLAAQQGARPDELLTAPGERTVETPAWVAAEMGEPASTGEPAEAVEAAAGAPQPEPEAFATPAAEALVLPEPPQPVGFEVEAPAGQPAMSEVEAEPAAILAGPAESLPVAAELAALEEDDALR